MKNKFDGPAAIQMLLVNLILDNGIIAEDEREFLIKLSKTPLDELKSLHLTDLEANILINYAMERYSVDSYAFQTIIEFLYKK